MMCKISGASTHPHLLRGLRTVAVFEALKGVLVFVVGFGLLSFVHHDLQAAAERIVHRFHLNPARHYPRVFIDTLTNLNDSRLRLLSALAFFYSSVRFVEAYGLWRTKGWAQWFAIVSGAIYLPLEVIELIRHATFLRGGVLMGNAGIVIYLIRLRWTRRRSVSP